MHIDSISYQSPNYNDRPNGIAIDALVIHTTEGNWDSDAEWMCNPASQVSTHYVVSPTGNVFQLVHPVQRAWHAGDSYYAGRDDWNNFSIGIEISHYVDQQYPSAQVKALDALAHELIPRYNVPQELVTCHRWVATNPPNRKSDPTNWEDPDFRFWVSTLYMTTPPADPLKVRTIAGIDRSYYCGVGFYDAYHKSSGMWWGGYAKSDETTYTDSTGKPATYMLFERLILKYNSTEGVRSALLSEAKQQGWI